jgi:RimJ/RimL family protein N-acetyltransferase
VITFQPITTDQDVQYVYELATHPDIGYRWLLRDGNVRSAGALMNALQQTCFEQFIVCRDGGKPFGHVMSYQPDFRDRHVSVGVAVDPELSGTGLGVMALGMFMDRTFHIADFRKLYAEVIDYNFEQFKSGTGSFFEVEGILRRHEYVLGSYHDVYILGFFREQFDDAWPRMRKTADRE